MKTKNDPGFFRIERHAENATLRLGVEGDTITIPDRTVTRQRIIDALGQLPSGTPNRREIAVERLITAGVIPVRRGITYEMEFEDRCAAEEEIHRRNGEYVSDEEADA